LSEYLKIGEVAKKANISVNCVRMYEEYGLISHSTKMDSGFRLYKEDVVNKAKFIKKAIGLGFQKSEIKELFELDLSDTKNLDSLTLKENKINEKLKLLIQMREALHYFLDGKSLNESKDNKDYIDILVGEKVL
tara:strand:+ start:773 stop:1174 length:402 start_codon:yes stop_codon:yes gene_type:complete